MTSKTRATLTPEQIAANNEVLGFEPEKSGSLQPMEANKGKWTHNLGAAALSSLATIVEDIETVITDTVNTVARSRLKIGSLLNDARTKFKGDKEFARWKKATLPHLASRTCNQYMQMASTYRNAPELVEAIGFNVAAELINAPPAILEQATKQALDPDDKNMTVAEVRKEKKTSNPPPLPDTTKQTSAPTPDQVTPPKVKKDSQDQVIRKVLQSNTSKRIEAALEGDLDFMDEYSRCAIIFGFGPELCDTQPNMGVFIAVYDHVAASLDEEETRILQQAYTKLKECWS